MNYLNYFELLKVQKDENLNFLYLFLVLKAFNHLKKCFYLFIMKNLFIDIRFVPHYSSEFVHNHYFF
jgi:hypothetical protein